MISIEIAKSFFLRDLRIAFSYRLNFFSKFLGVLLSTVLFFFIGELVGEESKVLKPYGGDYFAFALIGVAFTDYMFLAVNSFSEDIRRGQVEGTLESLLVSSISELALMIYSSLYKFCFTSLRIVLYLACGVLLFGLKIHLSDPFALLIVLLLTFAAFGGIGLASAAFVVLFKQTSPLNWIMGPLAGLAGGVVYPVTILPWWLKCISMLLPITHSLEALRNLLLNGASLYEVGNSILVLFCFAVTLMGIGLLLFKRALIIARKQGSLLHY